jgi:hypothetical protein
VNEGLLSLIVRDHRRLREMADELRESCGKADSAEGECFLRFRQMKAFFRAQSKAEEFTIYAHLEEGPAREDKDVLGLIFQGYEEHDLADLVLKEMGQAEELSLVWWSRLKVFSELIDHHMQKEELEFLPKGLDLLSDELKERLCLDYEHEREEIYAKKSGLKKSAFPYFSTTHNLSSH